MHSQSGLLFHGGLKNRFCTGIDESENAIHKYLDAVSAMLQDVCKAKAAGSFDSLLAPVEELHNTPCSILSGAVNESSLCSC